MGHDGRCAGCGRRDGILTEVEIGGRAEPICRRVHGAGVRQSCLRKARQRARRCPGCGREGIDPGEICRDCREVLRQEAARRQDGEPEWVGIRGAGIFGFLDEARHSRLALLLARAVGGGGVRKWIEHGYARHRIGRDASPWGSPDDAHVLASPPQVEALTEFCRILEDAFREARRAGERDALDRVRRARSLLCRMQDDFGRFIEGIEKE